MIQGEHSTILSTFIKLPFVIKVFVSSIFEWLFNTGFTIHEFTLQTKLPTVDSDISRIEQAISVCQCVLRHQFTIDTIKLNNGRFNYAGAFEINNIVIARGKGVSKKECKRDTYGNAMKNLMEKTIEELRLPVPEEDFVEIVVSEIWCQKTSSSHDEASGSDIVRCIKIDKSTCLVT